MARKYAPNRIRELRKAKGWSLEKLGLALDPPLSHTTIARLEESRGALSLDYIRGIAAALGVTPLEIMEEAVVQVHYAPVVGAIAAGNWEEAVELSDRTIPVPADAAGPRAFLLRIVGDSMGQQEDDGGYALVDPDDTDLIDGKQYAVMNEHGETTYKKYQASPSQLVPMSDNPNHKPIAIGRSSFVVIGRVRLTLRLTD